MKKTFIFLLKMETLIHNYITNLPRGNITSESECVICKEGFDIENRTDRKLNCSEKCQNPIYHEQCIIQWIKLNPINNTKCCYCQTSFSIQPIEELTQVQIEKNNLQKIYNKKISIKNTIFALFFLIFNIRFLLNLHNKYGVNIELFCILTMSSSLAYLNISFRELCGNRILIIPKCLHSLFSDILQVILYSCFYFNFNNHFNTFNYMFYSMITIVPFSFVYNMYVILKCYVFS